MKNGQTNSLKRWVHKTQTKERGKEELSFDISLYYEDYMIHFWMRFLTPLLLAWISNLFNWLSLLLSCACFCSCACACDLDRVHLCRRIYLNIQLISPPFPCGRLSTDCGRVHVYGASLGCAGAAADGRHSRKKVQRHHVSNTALHCAMLRD